MALTDILEKISKEATARIAELEKDYKAKITRLDEKNEEDKKKVDERIHQKVEENSKKIADKAENIAEIERKNQLLEAKRTVLDSALEKAISELGNLDNYEEVITNLLKKSELTGDNIVVIPAKGKEEATKAAIQAIKARIDIMTI